MFCDGRSKKIVFIAHCFLNQNSISDGTAVCPAVCRELVECLMNADIGMVQMPCPELCCLGLDRGNAEGAGSPVVVENTRIRGALKQEKASQTLTLLAEGVVRQILEYRRFGFEILGIIGANRSPSCGVDTTSDHNEEVEGMGLFMEELSRLLSENRISVPMIGLTGSGPIAEQLRRLI
ncbi:CD3072 family TudS-related putative desulfidase [uncultured Oscillibacter sp.]|uniref:CD3072 family TudS-related putative desulfidase n=1 Tax=uncultured Oscillibacter sp. TaxID=876091 RepID=UPI002610389B|nr:CD3072 family TudS-related putative desulfidase [uncultured Oscillibacter sp.]